MTLLHPQTSISFLFGAPAPPQPAESPPPQKKNREPRHGRPEAYGTFTARVIAPSHRATCCVATFAEI